MFFVVIVVKDTAPSLDNRPKVQFSKLSVQDSGVSVTAGLSGIDISRFEDIPALWRSAQQQVNDPAFSTVVADLLGAFTSIVPDVLVPESTNTPACTSSMVK